MPELPEVETIKLVLQRKIVGLTIKNIEILSTKSFIGKPQQIISKQVVKVWRRAKMLGIELSGKMTLLFHLKMTGQVIYQKSNIKNQNGRFVGGHPTEDMVGPMPNSHTRVIFTFNDESKLYFNDQRKFGWVKIIKGIENGVQGIVFEKLGPEPLEKDFTWQILKNNLLKHKSQPVKVALMDQSVVSGVGNIYSNEACFNAGIDPRTKVGNLTDNQFKSLHQGAQKALRDGISHGGSTRAHFRDPEGHKGYFLDYAYVYGLDKHPCKVCKTIIKKISLGGRGTYYCEKCQK
ncbi:bifunctional DNA-formamidopyrimidine glycosylase/DNA-(apurinic or apyrimidinic site) lyase [Candidatus Microgenomates bacterium]|nr:bifunctional DNA-formamidopyrimidine glycosylase/DNA-(apurinic or apyrimidinic site) lyase [Candidatus Microgenomates bacterium]